MHMIQMVGLVTLFYFVTLVLICLYRDKLSPRIGNFIFIAADVVFYFLWTYAYYLIGWLDKGFITLDNISPLMFTVMPLTYIVKDKVRNAAFCALAFLNAGMFVAMLFSPEFAYLFSYRDEASFVYTCEALCHGTCSLFGIYLILTRQVRITFKNWLRSIVFMLSVISFGVFLNIVFHMSFFGMDPYNGASIYMFDLFGSFPITLCAYYLGVVAVLTIGLEVGYLLDKWTHRKDYADTLLLEDSEPNADREAKVSTEAAEATEAAKDTATSNPPEACAQPTCDMPKTAE